VMMRFKAVTRSLHFKKEDLFLHLKIKSLNSMTLPPRRAATITYGIESLNLGNNYTINRLDYNQVLLLSVNFIFANLLKVNINV